VRPVRWAGRRRHRLLVPILRHLWNPARPARAGRAPRLRGHPDSTRSARRDRARHRTRRTVVKPPPRSR
jgi:hypothetical protein